MIVPKSVVLHPATLPLPRRNAGEQAAHPLSGPRSRPELPTATFHVWRTVRCQVSDGPDAAAAAAASRSPPLPE